MVKQICITVPEQFVKNLLPSEWGGVVGDLYDIDGKYYRLSPYGGPYDSITNGTVFGRTYAVYRKKYPSMIKTLLYYDNARTELGKEILTFRTLKKEVCPVLMEDMTNYLKKNGLVIHEIEKASYKEGRDAFRGRWASVPGGRRPTAPPPSVFAMTPSAVVLPPGSPPLPPPL